jgi:hypothetical protein
LSRNELPVDGNWAGVHTAVHRQMKKLDMSIARLSRESGISEPVIRNIGHPRKRQRSTLVAISAALGYPYDHLVDVLFGEADPEAPLGSPPETAFIKSLRAEVEPLKVQVDVINGKVDDLLERKREE